MKVTCPMCGGGGIWRREGTASVVPPCPGCGGLGYQEDRQATGWPAFPDSRTESALKMMKEILDQQQVAMEDLSRRVVALEEQRRKRA